MAKAATRTSKKSAPAPETPVVTTVTAKVPPAPSTKAVSCAPQGAPVAGVAPLAACKTRKPTHDEISARAHDVWVRKGRPSGLDEANWLEAEKELLGA